jgi:hypothetical protein
VQGGRIVFEVAAEYSERSHDWKDVLRLWVRRRCGTSLL